MINTREIAAEYRLSHWAQVMQERAQSGLSIKEFCRQIGICGNTYFYWQRRLRAAAVEGLAVKSNKSIVPSGWAVCETEQTVPVDSSGSKGKVVSIEIGKSRITADADVDPELLEKVCRVLVTLC